LRTWRYAADDETPRRIPRRERAAALGDEAAQAGDEQNRADREDAGAANLLQPFAPIRCEMKGNRVALPDPARNEDRDRERQDGDREQLTHQPDHECG
jgi:hypothetical protein